MPFTMAEVMFEMISLVFEDIDGFVFNLPASPPNFADKRNIF